jgi:transposase-like protein
MLDHAHRQKAFEVGKRKAYSRQQVAAILHQYANGTPVSVVCARTGVSRSTLYRWRASAVTQHRDSLEDENRSLRRRVNALEVDKTLLQEILRRDRGSR